jgi:thioesterase domain-containing protein
MTPAGLETYLHDHIPLSRAMAVRVVSIADDAVVLGAPLAPNINHHGTAFGGSGATLATLAAWSLLHLRLIAVGLPSDEVIQSSSMDYLTPIDSDFIAVARLEDGADWDSFVAMLTRRGRARIGIQAELMTQERVAARFHGRFAAVRTVLA